MLSVLELLLDVICVMHSIRRIFGNIPRTNTIHTRYRDRNSKQIFCYIKFDIEVFDGL